MICNRELPEGTFSNNILSRENPRFVTVLSPEKSHNRALKPNHDPPAAIPHIHDIR